MDFRWQEIPYTPIWCPRTQFGSEIGGNLDIHVLLRPVRLPRRASREIGRLLCFGHYNFQIMNEISLKTQRLLLRPWTDTDLPWLTAMNQDPKVMEFIGPVLSETDSRAMIERARRSWNENGYGRFAIEISETSELIGFVGVAQCRFESHFTPAVEIGWRLSHKNWGFGYATEAATEVMSWTFNTFEIDELVSFTRISNLRSRRVMEKIGMERNPGDDFLHPNKAANDLFRMNVLYRKRKAP